MGSMRIGPLLGLVTLRGTRPAMVFFFQASNGWQIYMGKDKNENEDLIKYSFPTDVWFHVDDLSSAHVYLRMPFRKTLEDIPEEVLEQCKQIVKENSIEGSKRATVNICYTLAPNLKKTQDMAVGQVGFRRPREVQHVRCDKDRNIVKALNATKKEEFPDLKAMKDMYDRKAMQAEKARRKKAKEAERQRVEEAKAEADRRDYRHMMSADNMRLNSEFSATADDSAAKEYEDSFM